MTTRERVSDSLRGGAAQLVPSSRVRATASTSPATAFVSWSGPGARARLGGVSAVGLCSQRPRRGSSHPSEPRQVGCCARATYSVGLPPPTRRCRRSAASDRDPFVLLGVEGRAITLATLRWRELRCSNWVPRVPPRLIAEVVIGSAPCSHRVNVSARYRALRSRRTVLRSTPAASSRRTIMPTCFWLRFCLP
jgi:hypothetical protein